MKLTSNTFADGARIPVKMDGGAQDVTGNLATTATRTSPGPTCRLAHVRWG